MKWLIKLFSRRRTSAKKALPWIKPKERMEIARICRNPDLKGIYEREVLENGNEYAALDVAKNYARIRGIKW